MPFGFSIRPLFSLRPSIPFFRTKYMDFLLHNIFWVAVAAISGVLLLWNNFRTEGGVSPQDAVHLINREHGVFLDVRAADAFAGGHLPNARNIPIADLETRRGELEKSKNRPIVIYGEAAGKAAAILQKGGFEK